MEFHYFTKMVRFRPNAQKCFKEGYLQRQLFILYLLANNHIYFAKHLPSLTDVSVTEEEYDEVEQMLEYFAFTMLGVPIP